MEIVRDNWSKDWGLEMFCLFAFVFKVGTRKNGLMKKRINPLFMIVPLLITLVAILNS